MSIDAIEPGNNIAHEAGRHAAPHLVNGMQFMNGHEVVFLPTGGAAAEIPAPRMPDAESVYESNGSTILRVLEGAEQMTEALKQDVTAEMIMAAARYKVAVTIYPVHEPEPGEARQTIVSVAPSTREISTASGWRPVHTYEYSSKDPFHDLNPELVMATSDLISTTMAQAARLHPTRDPELTYLNLARSRKGRKQTLLTHELIDIDLGMGDWITHLPDAERLRPVAKPWSDEPTVILDETVKDSDVFVEIPQTPAQQTLMGASGDGWGVREREAWERSKISEIIESADASNGELTITSLGTGTGEPAVDSALAVMERKYGEGAFKVTVNGIDVNPNSLKVAAHIAKNKQTSGVLEFNGRLANLLTAEGIATAVGGTQANVYEAIGFAEYVPSAHAASEMEQEQRERMRKYGCLSAEEFYQAIYDNMPEGSVLLTGNMRDDSPQASFVIDGLGWQGIIQRSTEEYLGILERAGIPAEAVELYEPDQQNSAGVYNLVSIKKL